MDSNNKPTANQPKRSRKKPAAGELTAQEIKLLDASTDIYSTPPDGNDWAFMHSVFCQVGLPRAKVEGREFMRQSGASWVHVQAGYLDEGRGPVLQPIPYGPLPRLALAHMSTYAVRNKTQEIAIGDTPAEFLRMMGMDDQGARYTNLRRHMHALAACRLQLGYRGRTFNGEPIQQFDAWVSNRDTKQRSLWPGVIVLSNGFYGSLMEGAVPLDIYAWLAHRLHRIEGRGIILHWKSLREQFAQEYSGKDADKNFKDAFLPQLRKVLAAYPQAKVKQVTGGLLLLGSPPPIPAKG